MPAQGQRFRHRYLASKVLVYLLYGAYTWRVPADGGVVVRIGPASKHLHISFTRLVDQLQWLHTHGFVEHVEILGGQATVKFKKPDVWAA